MGGSLEGAVAVVGMAGRFPGARDVDEFWRNLTGGVESVRRLGGEEVAALGVPAAVAADPAFVPAVAMPEGIDEMDAEFFGISHREAEIMDPQHRLFLECCWEALESAGCVAESFAGDIAVFGGTTTSTYLVWHLAGNPRLAGAVDPLQVIVGNAVDSLTTRVSFKLGLRGQSYAVQCACSTGLVAVHKACESLLYEQCDMALAGAVSINVGLRAGYRWQPDSILSPDGHCRAFDAAAEGTIFGGGVGVVALRRLEDALAAGDPVRAVIRGSAVNNDGSTKAGFSAPSVEGEARAVVEALAVAGAAPDTIGYVEAHGTGTALGDPIEVEALNRAFRAGTQRRGFCALGTVKSNIGHLDVAAGIAGFIKTVLVLEHGVIPPSLHFERPNPRIDFAASPFYVNRRLAAWPGGRPRRAGVSAFGFGGTNAHVVLEEAPPAPSAAGREAARRPARLLLLSARSAAALDAATLRLAERLRGAPELDLGDVAWTLHAGRRTFPCRRMAVCGTVAEAAAVLGGGGEPARLASARDTAAPRQRAVAFLLPGQGAQHAGMGREVYDAEPVFRAEVDRCAELLAPHLGMDLRRVLYPTATPGDQGTAAGAAEDALTATQLAQPALFVVELALARLWQSWGVQPQALLGHSVGEYVAACIAGVFSVADALAVVAARGRLIGELPRGAMLAVALSEGELAAALAAPGLPPGLAVAAINEPRRVVAAGPLPAIEALALRLAGEGIETRRLHTSHAFHSPALAAAAEPFRAVLRQVRLSPPAIPFVSNVSGTWIGDADATSPEYWVRHLLAPVRFADGLAALAADPDRLLLEVGPGRTLTALAARATAATSAPPLPSSPSAPSSLSAPSAPIASLPHPRESGGEYRHLLAAAGRLWLAGQQLDAAALQSGGERRRVPLPTYPFERRRYWIEAANPGAPYGAAPVGDYGMAPGDACGAARAGAPGEVGEAGEACGAAEAGYGGAAAGALEGAAGTAGSARAAASGEAGASGAAAGGGTLHPRPPLPTPFVAPSGELEEQVAAIWCEVLGLAEIGVQDSFLDLGGDSLLATRLLARLRQELQVQLAVDRLFERPTVAAVAALVIESFAGVSGGDDLARLVAEIHGLSADQLEEELATAGPGADGRSVAGGKPRRG